MLMFNSYAFDGLCNEGVSHLQTWKWRMQNNVQNPSYFWEKHIEFPKFFHKYFFPIHQIFILIQRYATIDKIEATTSIYVSEDASFKPFNVIQRWRQASIQKHGCEVFEFKILDGRFRTTKELKPGIMTSFRTTVTYTVMTSPHRYTTRL